MTVDKSSMRPDIAACGLYCGTCPKLQKKQCPGCRDNVKAGWCKIRQCCLDNGYGSCADCTRMPLESCKKFNNLIGKIFGLLFRSDRTACIARIRDIGYDRYGAEMLASGRMTIRK